MKKLLIIWFVCGIAALALVKFTKIGPTIFTISAEHSWGIHSGDLLVVLPVAVAVIAAVKLLPRRGGK